MVVAVVGGGRDGGGRDGGVCESIPSMAFPPVLMLCNEPRSGEAAPFFPFIPEGEKKALNIGQMFLRSRIAPPT